MILHALTLDGVGPYADRQTIDFAQGERRPVTLVGGLNGAGKTTLMRALFHVLYGKRSLAEVGHRGAYGGFLDGSVNAGRTSASLELTLTVPGLRDGERLTVRRSWKRGGTADELDVFVQDAYDEELSESWDETIEQIAPLGVARLFFFDGEKIEALADLGAAASTLRTAVGALLGMDLVEQLQTDLVAVQRRALREEGGVSSEALERREAELRAAEELHASAQAHLAELEATVADERDSHAGLRNALRASGGDLLEQRDALEAEADAARDEEQELWEQLRQSAADPYAPLTLVPGLLGDLAATADRHDRHTSDRRLLAALEERDAWLTAELADLAARPRTKLAGLLETDRAERAERLGKRAPFAPRSASGTLDELRERVTGWRAQQLQSIDALDQAAARTDELDRRISRIPSPDAVRIVLDGELEGRERVAAAEAQLSEQHQLLRAAESQVERARDRRDAELRRLAEVEEGHERRERVVRHAEAAKETLANLRARVVARHISRIADYAMESLQQLLRKDRLVCGIEIDPATFELTLRAGDGGILRPGALSAGERQLTALALLWALARAAGRPLPVVIDTPLGRLDAGHRRHVVARYLPAASHQVVVLSTDTEIDAELHGALEPSIGTERWLETDADGRTVIRDGYLELAAT